MGILKSRLTLAELRSATCSLQTVLLKASGSKTLYLSRFMRVMPLGCPFGCPREAPILVWRLFPLAFYNIAQDDCFFKRQEEKPILFGSSTGYSALVKQTSTLQFLFLNLTSPFFLGFQGHCPRQAESVRTDSLLVKTRMVFTASMKE